MKWTLAVVVMAACSSKSSEPHDKPVTAVEVTWAPRVTTGNVLATSSDPPPPVIVIDAAGNGLMSPATTWDALSTHDPAAGAEPLTAATIALLSPRMGPKSPTTLQEDDGEDESGGTGSTVLLEEKPYRPEPVPEAVVERNKLLSIAGGAITDKRHEQPAAPMPIHKVIGEVMNDGTLTKPSAVIVAAPTAKATTVVDLVALTNAALGVVHEGTIRPLRLDFAERGDRQYVGRNWIEVRVGAKGLGVELVPGAPVRTDRATLIATLDQLRKERGLDPRTRVDVLVEPDVDVQTLVDVLVALDQASVLMIGVGHAPAADSEQAKQRGSRRPTLWFGQPNAQGDLDKAIIRERVRGQHVALSACHTKQLADKPALAGTVQTMFFIKPNGTVADARAEGLDPAVASCVQKIIKAVVFPKPKGGGGVQVNYPLTFRP